ARPYVTRRDVLATPRHFSPEILKPSDLVSPGARQAKVSEGK
ncbi:hypothetical protein A2U01_0115462, partial [Trifolium medium]|nr:hypothetical protein [Trifolium medium]